MSTCISKHGEFSAHTLGEGENEFTCTLCWVEDTDAMRAALAEVTASLRYSENARDIMRREKEHGWAEADRMESERDIALAELAALRAAGGQESGDGSDYTDMELPADSADVVRQVAAALGFDLDIDEDRDEPLFKFHRLAAPVGGQAEPSDAERAGDQAAEWMRRVAPIHTQLIDAAIHDMADQDCDLANGDSYDPEQYRSHATGAVGSIVNLLAWTDGFTLAAAAAVSGEQAIPPSEEPKCRRCSGTGGVPFDGDMVECHNCEGTGVAPQPAAPVGGQAEPSDARIGFSVWLDREQWGLVGDGLMAQRELLLERKRINSESTADLSADAVADVLHLLSAADPITGSAAAVSGEQA